MRPSYFYDILSTDSVLNGLGIDGTRIAEAQSEDERPINSGLFVMVSFEETASFVSGIDRGPRTVIFAVHQPWDETRDYDGINKVLNRIHQLFSPIDQGVGNDGVRVSQMQRRMRSGNQVDEGWRTITRWETYGVLYDELAV